MEVNLFLSDLIRIHIKIKKIQTKTPNIKDRLPILKDEIEKQIYRIENDMNSEFLEIIYLYFDENTF